MTPLNAAFQVMISWFINPPKTYTRKDLSSRQETPNGYEPIGGDDDDDDDDTQMRAHRCRHMGAHDSRNIRAHIWEHTYESRHMRAHT